MEEERKQVVILIPALDPPDGFAAYVHELTEAGFRNIIVVDDGSGRTGSFEEIRRMGHVVLRHEKNKGKGQALKTGMSYYRKQYSSCEYAGIITVDSDGQHLAGDVKKIAERLSGGESRLILGSRDFSLPQVPPKSRFGNNLTARIFRCFLRMNVKDTQTGLRGIPDPLVSECIRLSGKRFEYETEMLMSVGKKAGICEIPIETVYLEENKGTHFNPVVDSLKIYYVIFRTFLKYLFSSLSAALLDISLFALFSKVIFAGREYKIWAATAMARAASACYNFCVNKRFVFKSDRSLAVSAAGYFGLCIAQGAVSAALVFLITDFLKADEVLVKLPVDTMLFFVSYQVQQKLIFKRREGDGEGKIED